MTYPRTESRYLTHDMQPKMVQLASNVQGLMPFATGLKLASHAEQTIDDEKVTDHHAIIPTDSMPKLMSTAKSLPESVQDILNLVCVRLLCAMDEPFVYDETVVTLECAGHAFKVKGRRILQMGWKRFWEAFRGSLGKRITEEQRVTEVQIPSDLAEGEAFDHLKPQVAEGKTKPPAHHTEDTILHAMETASAEDMPEDAEHRGIGTPATRASILEKLLETKLVERAGNRRRRILVPTAKGEALVSVLPEKLLSPQLTADWEQRLKRIEKGEERAEDFMKDISDYVQELTNNINRSDKAAALFQPLRQKICACPKCGAVITDRPKGFMCENRTCRFTLWKNGGILKGAEQPLTATDVKELVEKGFIRKKGLLSSKSHIRYNAMLRLTYAENGKPILKPVFN